jgi:hypothetical protein
VNNVAKIIINLILQIYKQLLLHAIFSKISLMLVIYQNEKKISTLILTENKPFMSRKLGFCGANIQIAKIWIIFLLVYLIMGQK